MKYLFFVLALLASSTIAAQPTGTNANIFEVEAATNFEELKKAVQDAAFDTRRKDAEQFDKANAFEVLKSQYFSEALQSPSIQVYIVYELIALRKLHEGSEPPDNDTENKLLEKFKAKAEGGASVEELSKGFTEGELIEIGRVLGFEWTTKGTKSEKVKAILQRLEG